MKRLMMLVLCLGFVAVCAAPAEAGLFKRIRARRQAQCCQQQCQQRCQPVRTVARAAVRAPAVVVRGAVRLAPPWNGKLQCRGGVCRTQ